MLVWHSKHAWSPTNRAPGTSGATARVTGVVEHEFNARATLAASPKPAAAARYRAGVLFAGWPLTAYVSDEVKHLFLRIFAWRSFESMNPHSLVLVVVPFEDEAETEDASFGSWPGPPAHADPQP